MNLKTYRLSKKMTQLELANLLAVKRTTVSMWETCKSKPKIETMQKLAEVLNVDLVTILACFYGEPKEIES